MKKEEEEGKKTEEKKKKQVKLGKRASESVWVAVSTFAAAEGRIASQPARDSAPKGLKTPASCQQLTNGKQSSIAIRSDVIVAAAAIHVSQ